jgi:hypothetical protein
MRIQRFLLRSISLSAAVLVGGASGCAGEPSSPDEEESHELPGPDPAVVHPADEIIDIAEDLVATVPLPDGAEIRFYVHEDGSASVIEDGTSDHIAIGTQPELEDANAYEVFYAVSPEGTPVPEELVRHHRAMLADEGIAETPSPLPQGWALDELVTMPLSSGGGCAASIQSFVCDQAGSAYPSGPGCWSSWTGTLAWYDNDQPMRRYRTGYCSTGTVEASITGGYAGPGDCVVFRIAFIYQSGVYSNKNWHYWWSGPSGATPRSYDNRVEHISGAGFAWGVREKWHTSSSCKI